MPTMSSRALAAIPAVPLGVIVAIVLTVAVHPVAGFVFGVVVGAALFFWVLNGAVGPALRALGAFPLDEGSEPRLESLVESICAGHGTGSQSLIVSVAMAAAATSAAAPPPQPGRRN